MYTITSITPTLIIIALVALAAIFFYLGTKFSSGGVRTPKGAKWNLSGEWGAETRAQKASLNGIYETLNLYFPLGEPCHGDMWFKEAEEQFEFIKEKVNEWKLNTSFLREVELRIYGSLMKGGRFDAAAKFALKHNL